jgi:hypothetical protein
MRLRQGGRVVPPRPVVHLVVEAMDPVQQTQRERERHLGHRLRHRLPCLASPGSSSTTTSPSAPSRVTLAAPNTISRNDGVAASTIRSFSAMAEF